MVRMLSTKMLTGKTWPMSAVRARARTMLMTLSTSGMVAASTAPKTMTSTIRAAGTPKISPRERSFSASSVNIWLRLASPAWAMVKPSLWPVMAASWTWSTFFIASSTLPVMITGTSVACLSLETRPGSLVA